MTWDVHTIPTDNAVTVVATSAFSLGARGASANEATTVPTYKEKDTEGEP